MQQASGHRLASARGRETCPPVGVDLVWNTRPGLKFGQSHGSILVGVGARESFVTLRREFRKTQLAVAISVCRTGAHLALLCALRRLLAALKAWRATRSSRRTAGKATSTFHTRAIPVAPPEDHRRSGTARTPHARA